MLCAAGPQAGDKDLSPQPCRRRQTGSWLEADSYPLRWQEGLRPLDASSPVKRGQQPAVQGTGREQTLCHPASGVEAASEAWGTAAPPAASPGGGRARSGKHCTQDGLQAPGSHVCVHLTRDGCVAGRLSAGLPAGSSPASFWSLKTGRAFRPTSCSCNSSHTAAECGFGIWLL